MYLNKLLILKKLQQTNTHLGLIIGAKNSKWSRFRAQRLQSYVFGFRASQPIIDLDKTIISLRRACNVIQLIIRSNGHLLLVNTNPSYNKIIQQTANITNQSYINHKWIGGFLTNWNHMQNVQKQFYAATRFSKYWKNPQQGNISGKLDEPKAFNKSGKKSNQSSALVLQFLESSLLTQAPRYKKMQKCFEGSVKTSNWTASKPDCVIIFNATQNSTAIYEAHLNQIPIISIVDSNVPSVLYNKITYPVPANYDSVQFVYLFCNCILKIILASQQR